MKKICIVVITPMTVKAFLLKHIEVLSKEYEITIVSNSDSIDDIVNLLIELKNINLPNRKEVRNYAI